MKARKLLRKLNYLPRWMYYLGSFFVGGPFGPLVVYAIFRVLNAKADDEENEEAEARARQMFNFDVDIDTDGIHVRGRSPQAEYTVRSDSDVRRDWNRVQQSAEQAAQASVEQTQASTQSDEVSEVIRAGKAALLQIRHANDLIPDPELTRQIDSIENSCRQILALLEQRPQLLSQMRTFLRYYLPTTLRLLDARAKLEKTANTQKARQVREQISVALGEVDKAFQNQLEALDEYRFIDLESEMDTLRDMLRSDGLTNSDEQEDPFADVLSERRAQKAAKKPAAQQGTPLAGH